MATEGYVPAYQPTYYTPPAPPVVLPQMEWNVPPPRQGVHCYQNYGMVSCY